MYGLAAGFLAAAWGRLLPPSLTAFSLILWWSLPISTTAVPMYPWPSVDSLVFQAAALYFLLKSTPAAGMRSLAYPLLCGASAGPVLLVPVQRGVAPDRRARCLLCDPGVRRRGAALGLAAPVRLRRRERRGPPRLPGDPRPPRHATTDWIDQNYTFFAKMYASEHAHGPLASARMSCSYHRRSAPPSGATPCGPSCRSSSSSRASPCSPSASWDAFSRRHRSRPGPG